MRCDENYMLLYAVTDRAWLGKKTLLMQVEEALKGGATCIQLREKELEEGEFIKEAMEIQAICKEYNIPFIINDNVAVALACNADGIHVGQSDMQASNVRERIGDEKILGVSVQTVEQAIKAWEDGADYLGVGAVFTTSTKLDADFVSNDILKDICSAVSIPVVAIGGINKQNITELTGTGVDGVALVSAIFASEDIAKECKELYNLSTQMVHPMRKVLTIAGSDSSGGAGIQADIKTITVHKMYAMSAITALTAQNTMGVTSILDATPEFVGQQLDCIFTDIFPDAVKIGMVSNSEIIEVIAKKLVQYGAKNIVVDPVMVSTSGSKLLTDKARDTLTEKLLVLGKVVTPNIPEAEVLCGFKIKNEEDMIRAAKAISSNLGGAVLVKGGHLVNDAIDLLYENGEVYWYRSERVDNFNTHGTGCTLSSAIACNLADGKTLDESIRNAKEYLTGALNADLNLGSGQGPMNHMYRI